ncbi:30S ribosomal protein S6 alpha, chloroplastic-like protein [Tanacetum coccineum]|uniref:30S ribosomal protein S6 alpha, chloroplastic-like protein n=1 Tax=Tanacetum coccineum TaxID=301880 RepID=A0ABQ5H4V3_9ASTR
MHLGCPYSIKKKNNVGETSTYSDGIYLLFKYFTKPESLEVLETTLKRDDDVISTETGTAKGYGNGKRQKSKIQDTGTA